MEIWRLALWIARCQAFRQAADAYCRAHNPGLCRVAWFVSNVLLRRGPLFNPEESWWRTPVGRR